MRKWLIRIVIGVVALFIVAQLIPYGRNHTNPPVLAEPQWSSPQTRALAQKACFDCHSNLTKWPWYTNIAPQSWLAYSDVSGGRSSLNFSEWTKPQDGAGDAIDAISSGSMPPWFYVILHPKAGLSSADKQALMTGLAATFKTSPPIAGSG
jgi:cytochrome c551/c552